MGNGCAVVMIMAFSHLLLVTADAGLPSQLQQLSNDITHLDLEMRVASYQPPEPTSDMSGYVSTVLSDVISEMGLTTEFEEFKQQEQKMAVAAEKRGLDSVNAQELELQLVVPPCVADLREKAKNGADIPKENVKICFNQLLAAKETQMQSDWEEGRSIKFMGGPKKSSRIYDRYFINNELEDPTNPGCARTDELVWSHPGDHSGVPKAFSGVWWMQGNPQPDELASLGGATWTPRDPNGSGGTAAVEVAGHHVWSFHGNKAGSDLWDKLKFLNAEYLFNMDAWSCEEQDGNSCDRAFQQPTAMTLNLKINKGFISMTLLDKFRVKFTGTLMPECPGGHSWRRDSKFPGAAEHTYFLRRIVDGDGKIVKDVKDDEGNVLCPGYDSYLRHLKENQDIKKSFEKCEPNYGTWTGGCKAGHMQQLPTTQFVSQCWKGCKYSLTQMKQMLGMLWAPGCPDRN